MRKKEVNDTFFDVEIFRSGRKNFRRIEIYGRTIEGVCVPRGIVYVYGFIKRCTIVTLRLYFCTSSMYIDIYIHLQQYRLADTRSHVLGGTLASDFHPDEIYVWKYPEKRHACGISRTAAGGSGPLSLSLQHRPNPPFTILPLFHPPASLSSFPAATLTAAHCTIISSYLRVRFSLLASLPYTHI